MIFCAVTGPIPSIWSSCSMVAVPRLIGPLCPVAAELDRIPGPGTTTCWPSLSLAARLIPSSAARD